MHGDLALEIESWDWPNFASVTDLQVSRPAQVVAELAEFGFFATLYTSGVSDPGCSAYENDCVTHILEPLRCNVPLMLDQPHHCNGRSGVDDARGTFII